MSTTPLLDQQQQPPPTAAIQQPYMAHNTNPSVGPVIGVLAFITILGVLAGMIGRLCSGRRIMGYGQYDVEGWIETKCSSCIDGRIDEPPPRRATEVATGEDVPVAEPVESREEIN